MRLSALALNHSKTKNLHHHVIAPLAGVLITVTGQAYTTTTDADGNYTLKIPVPGDYELVFTKSSYVPQTQSNVSLTLGETTDLDISLESLPA